MSSLRRLVVLLALSGCGAEDVPDGGVDPGGAWAATKAIAVDADGDGEPNTTDCDDANPAAYTGAAEVCDAVDTDCDGIVDNDACPCVDDTDGDHAFLFCTTDATWDDAQAACAGFGYHLADVEDAAEEAWIWATAESIDGGTGWWHGANDRATEGVFAWDGGADSAWASWRAGEPNDYLGGEDCGAFADDGGGAWNDKACTVAYPYVCEAGCRWSTWYADTDGDGFGDASAATRACDAPADTVADATDCDDADASVSPGGAEVCGGADEDCDGLFDAADSSVDPGTFVAGWADADGDGYGGDVPVLGCAGGAGVSAVGGDCDDTDPTVYPGAPDVEDGRDGDCDGYAEVDDTDDDGLTRADEVALGLHPDNPDSDADGLPDGAEVGDPDAPYDHDADGAIDALDADDDGDRLTTLGEIGAYDWADPAASPDDTDRDGTPDHLDRDSDADTVPDGEDSVVDTDRDRVPNVEDPDDDGDALPTADERSIDIDGDGVPDRDPDGDGVESWLDTDADGDGCRDGTLDGPSDPNENGIPAWVDPAECGGTTAIVPPSAEPETCGCAAGPAAGGSPILLLLGAAAAFRRRRASA